MAKRISFDVNDTSRSTTKLIILLAWPVFVEQIFTTLVSYADTAMVGALGKTATASITISNSPIFLLNGIIMSLGVGITALVAQGTGSGDKELVRKLIRHAMVLVIMLGVPITAIVIALHRLIPLWMGAGEDIIDLAAQYNLIVGFGRFFNLMSMTLNSVFRGYGDTKTPLKANMTMNIVNVVGNFFLINPTREVHWLGGLINMTMPGAGWGVAGAAAATSVSMFVCGVITLCVAFGKNNPYRLTLKDSYRLDGALMKKIFHISLPAMLQRFCMSSSGIFVTSSIALLGTAAIAANSLSLTAESLSFMPAFAFQTAATTLTGQCIGAKRLDRAEEFVKKCLLLGSVIMAATTVLMLLFARQLISIFTPDEEVIELGAKCLMISACIQVPQVITWVYSGALQGAGDTKSIFYISAGTNWFIRTLFSVLLIRVFHLGLIEVHYVTSVECLARLLFTWLRYRSGKWKEIGERLGMQRRGPATE